MVYRINNFITDQTAALNLFGNGLVYHSAPFDRPTEISGYVKLAAWMAIDAPDVDFHVTLHEIMRALIHLLPAVKAAATSGLPVFLSVHCTIEGIMESGETMQDVVTALDRVRLRVDALLLMCSPPAAISATLPHLRAAFAGPIGAYANIGYKRAITTEAPRFPETQYHGINTGENTPEHYAEYARQWRAMGAQIIGGCCATTPAHIAALAPVVKGNHSSRE